MSTTNPNTFFCIYSGKDAPFASRTLEHIVPYSLGGTGEFGTRDVSSKANNDIGSFVDARLINHPFITIERWRLQLKGHSGTVPGIEMSGTIDIDGRRVKADYVINPDGTVHLETYPIVEQQGETLSFRVACDPAKLPTILENIAKKPVKNGLTASRRDVKIEITPVKEMILANPSLNIEKQFNIFDMFPGFIKMALGTGHLVFGETWSRGAEASMLRDVIRDKDKARQVATKLHGRIWPNQDPDDPVMRNMVIDNDHHVLFILNKNPVAFYALLFGKFSGVIQLRDLPLESPELPPGKGVVFVIDCKTRKLCKFDYQEFVVEQATKKGWIPPPIDG